MHWPIWSRFLIGAFILYSGLLCAVGLSVFVSVLRNRWSLKLDDIVIQALMSVFLPFLLIGLWNPRLASGLLIAGAVVNLLLFLSMNRTTGDGTSGMIVASLAFLGAPMLGASFFLRHISRESTPPA